MTERPPIVTHYTEEEGGAWLPWPADDMPEPYWLLMKLEGAIAAGETALDRIRRGVREMYVAPVMFHALRFDNGRVWDTINGWRPTPYFDRPDLVVGERCG